MLNPITNILLIFRDVMLNNRIPGVGSLLLAFVEVTIVLALGLYIFYKRQDTFILDI